jgi:hypothetical protein
MGTLTYCRLYTCAAKREVREPVGVKQNLNPCDFFGSKLFNTKSNAVSVAFFFLAPHCMVIPQKNANTYRKFLTNLKKNAPTYVAWCVPVPVQVLVPQKNRACCAPGFLNQAPVFRNSSYYKGGETQKTPPCK